MASTPAPPEIEREIHIEDIPVAETELEPPYRVLVHNKDATFPIWSCSIFHLADITSHKTTVCKTGVDKQGGGKMPGPVIS
jgi:hypothetical protein